MKKIFSKVSSVAVFLNILAILCYVSPFLKLEGTITTLNAVYVTGLELVTDWNMYGANFHESLQGFHMSITVTATLVFTVLALILNAASDKKKGLAVLACLLEIGGAVMTYAIAPWCTWGYPISVAAWHVYVHVGSMVCASFLAISAFLSIAQAFSKK